MNLFIVLILLATVLVVFEAITARSVVAIIAAALLVVACILHFT